MHSHDGHQLLFLLRGTTAYEFKGRRAKTVELPGGHFLVIPPGAVHRGIQDMRPPCVLFDLVLADGARGVCRNTPFTPAEWRWLQLQLGRARLSVHPLGAELRRVAISFTRELGNFRLRPDDPLRAARVRALACAVLLEAAGQLSHAARGAADKSVQMAAGYLRAHLGQKLRMSDV
ncbi:MAG: AraC family ligand binding domain-containing protein, partial [Verrucomicrobia bacterium]|nr:AraC family ligand binding domain-containing protein [Verrucomicrobiota bacterium]